MVATSFATDRNGGGGNREQSWLGEGLQDNWGDGGWLRVGPAMGGAVGGWLIPLSLFGMGSQGEEPKGV